MQAKSVYNSIVRIKLKDKLRYENVKIGVFLGGKIVIRKNVLRKHVNVSVRSINFIVILNFIVFDPNFMVLMIYSKIYKK